MDQDLDQLRALVPAAAPAPQNGSGSQIEQLRALVPATTQTSAPLDGAAGGSGWSYQRPDVGMAEGVTRSGLQGQSLGFGDEIVAGLAATAAPLVNDNLGDFFSGEDWSRRYDTFLARERAENQQFKTDNPKTALAAEITGGVLTGAGAGGAAVSGAKTTAQMAGRGAAVGAALGGVTGFGEGEGGAQARAENSIPYALAGGVMGAGVPYVLKGGKGVVDYIKTKAAKTGTDEAALTRIYTGLMKDGFSPEQAIAEMERRGAALVDLGPNMRRLGEKTVLYESPALTQADDFFHERAARQFGRAMDALQDAVDPEAAKAYFPKGEAGFQEALGRKIKFTDELRGILARPAVRTAYNRVRARLLNSGEIPPDQVDVYMPDLDTLVSDKSVVEIETSVLHRMKRAMDAMVNPGRDHRGVPIGVDQDAVDGVNDALTAFRSHVRMLNPDYDRVLKTEMLAIRGDKALDLGKDALKPSMSPERIRQQLFNMSGAEHAIERRRFQLGFVEAIEEKLAGKGELDENVTRQIIALTPKIEAVFGDKAAGIVAQMKNLREFSQTANAIMAGSPTARRLAGDNLDNAIAGHMVDAARDGGQGVISSIIAGLRNIVTKPSGPMLDGLGQRLFSDTPATRARLMAELSAARQGAGQLATVQGVTSGASAAGGSQWANRPPRLGN